MGIFELTLSSVIEHMSVSTSFGHDLVVVELSGDGPRKVEPIQGMSMRIDGISVILIVEGTMDITIDNRSYNISSGALLDLFDLHVFRDMHLSSDFRGYHVLLSKNFLAETMRDIKRLPISSFLDRKAHPVCMLLPDEMELLRNVIQRIVVGVGRKNHIWHRDLVKNELRNLFIEVGNIVIPHRSADQETRRFTTKDDLIGRFIRLLDKHGREEHQIAFYASELCIDAPYLSRILKTSSGRTAGRWIDDVLLREAKTCLRDPNLTIQQIADQLNFSDQSAFGKFFKKHTGKSPLQYRRGTG